MSIFTAARPKRLNETAGNGGGTQLLDKLSPQSAVKSTDTNSADCEIAELLNSGYRYALSLCANKADAEDYTHDAWVRATRRYGSAVDKKLLLTIVRNLHIDQCRRNSRHTKAHDVMFQMQSESSGVDLRGECEDLQRFLHKLRSTEREVLYLHAVEGYSAREISTLTETPRGTVLSLLARARTKLKTLMQAEDTQTTPRESV